MQWKPITDWESQTCYPSIHSADTLSKDTLQKLTAEAQNSRQADTAMNCTTRGTRTRRAAEQAATTP